jgi:hypothetical protein
MRQQPSAIAVVRYDVSEIRFAIANEWSISLHQGH